MASEALQDRLGKKIHAGELTITSDLPDAVKLLALIEIMTEEIDYLG